MDSFKASHANKAESYDIGRPEYPAGFFEYLYGGLGLSKGHVIADIGAGTGKITREFLKRGNKVFAVEPDKSMAEVLVNNLSGYESSVTLRSTAESTGIPNESVDVVFCGNSYHWFNRALVVPELKRIVKENGLGFDIIIASLGPEENYYDGELGAISKNFAKPAAKTTANTSMPFAEGRLRAEIFDYTIHESFDQFLHGCLSNSTMPSKEEGNYDEYCAALKQFYDKHSKEGALPANFKLRCSFGLVKDLVI